MHGGFVQQAHRASVGDEVFGVTHVACAVGIVHGGDYLQQAAVRLIVAFSLFHQCGLTIATGHRARGQELGGASAGVVEQAYGATCATASKIQHIFAAVIDGLFLQHAQSAAKFTRFGGEFGGGVFAGVDGNGVFGGFGLPVGCHGFGLETDGAQAYDSEQEVMRFHVLTLHAMWGLLYAKFVLPVGEKRGWALICGWANFHLTRRKISIEYCHTAFGDG